LPARAPPAGRASEQGAARGLVDDVEGSDE
jgi:hypothetical protein